jgi:hypothetical protein
VFDGEELVQLGAGAVIRRDAKLAEVSRVPVEGVTSVAVLADRSLVVLAGTTVHRIVNNKPASSHASTADLLLRATSPTAYWAINPRLLRRVNAASGSSELDVSVPENTKTPTAAVADDGSLGIANLWGLLHVEREIETFAWKNAPHAIGPGPDALSWWATLDLDKVALLHLASKTATALASHTLGQGESIVHFTSRGAIAAAVIARAIEPHRASLALVTFDAKGERWRVPLPDSRGYYAMLSSTRVVTLSTSGGAFRGYDLATGTEII